MKYVNIFITLFIIIIVTSCNSSTKSKENNVKPISGIDLEEILKEGKLKVSTTYSGTSYFLYKGQPMGFEYELLQRFAEYLEVELEIVVANDINNLIPNLNKGKVDLIAHGLTITSERKKKISFSEYIYLSHQVLVQKKPNNWRKMNWKTIENSLIHDAIELIGDTVSVREESSYLHRLNNLSEEIGGAIIIDTLHGSIATDKSIKMVVDGKIKYTVADDNIAKIIASYYPILDIEVPISFSQRIAWATRHSSPLLLKELDKWLEGFKKEVDYYVIYNKYFKNKRNFKKRVKSDFYSVNGNSISKYDDIIKKESKNIGWDWRLVSSLIYQESQFNPTSKSWAGAGGLMQIMPATAKELGVKVTSDPTESVAGGTKYLNILWKRFSDIEDPVQRIKFTMASYNCGHGHVLDAQQLAEKRELDKTKWDGNVEDMILELSFQENYNDPVVKFGYVRGIEPYNYIREIFERYEHYKEFIEE